MRLRPTGASEKATAPGKDIRDIGPERVSNRCGTCGRVVPDDKRRTCTKCRSDEAIVTEVRRELKRLGLPDLGQKTEACTPYSKKRQKAEAAMARMKKAKRETQGQALGAELPSKPRYPRSAGSASSSFQRPGSVTPDP